MSLGGGQIPEWSWYLVVEKTAWPLRHDFMFMTGYLHQELPLASTEAKYLSLF